MGEAILVKVKSTQGLMVPGKMITQIITGNSNFDAPEDMIGNVQVMLFGAGGGNGAGGNMNVGSFYIKPGQSVPVTIGAKVNGKNGGTTSFGTYLSGSGGEVVNFASNKSASGGTGCGGFIGLAINGGDGYYGGGGGGAGGFYWNAGTYKNSSNPGRGGNGGIYGGGGGGGGKESYDWSGTIDNNFKSEFGIGGKYGGNGGYGGCYNNINACKGENGTNTIYLNGAIDFIGYGKHGQLPNSSMNTHPSTHTSYFPITIGGCGGGGYGGNGGMAGWAHRYSDGIDYIWSGGGGGGGGGYGSNGYHGSSGNSYGEGRSMNYNKGGGGGGYGGDAYGPYGGGYGKDNYAAGFGNKGGIAIIKYFIQST